MNYANFNPSQHSPPQDSGDFSPIPDGSYDAVCVTCEGKDTSTGAHQIEIRWDIVGPQYSGRVVWDRIYFQAPDNPTEGQLKAMQRGQADVAALCRMWGLQSFHPRSFVSRRSRIRVGTDPERTHNGKTYPPKNKVWAYKPIEGQAPQGMPQPGPLGNDDDLPF